MKCRECKYWIEAEGFEQKDNVGGCTYFYSSDGAYMPMWLDEECCLKEPYKSIVEKEHMSK